MRALRLGIGDKPTPGTDPASPDPKALAKDVGSLATFVNAVADAAGKNRAAINMMWTLLTGFLVMFMQCGFAMVETGLTRSKNVAHTTWRSAGSASTPAAPWPAPT